MSIKNVFVCILCTWGFYAASAQQAITANMGQVKLSFSLDRDGSPVYSVDYNKTPVILPSRLGFVLNEDNTFYKGFELLGSGKKSVDETWQPVWGETKNIRNHYNELTVHLREKNAPN